MMTVPPHPDREIDGGLRRRMIQRRRRQIDHAFAVLPELLQEIEQRQLLRRRLLRQRPQDAFRPAGGAGRIEHRGADDIRPRSACPGSPAVASRRPTMRSLSPVAVGDDAELDLGAFLERLARDVEFCHRCDENAGFAVVDDVGELARRQVGIDAGIIQSGPLAGAAGLQVAAVVLHEDRIVVEPLQAAIAKQMRQPIAARLQFAHRSRPRRCLP